MVKLAYAWIDPKTTYFRRTATVQMGTTLRDAELRYTLDGSAPSATSSRYEKPLTLERTTQVRAAAFQGAEMLGAVMSVEFVQPPMDAPQFAPAAGGFDEEMELALKPPADVEGEQIHYTLDGSAPTADSPRYSGPIKLKQTTTVRAVACVSGREGLATTATFCRRGVKPPVPNVHLSDLTALRATTGWGGKPRMNRSITNKPLSLGGTVYQKGIGVHAQSELEYELKPEYGQFVAVVGLDDAMKEHSEGSVAFEVWLDGKRVEETRILRASDYAYLNVPIAAGSKRIRLVVTDAIDGGSCDHGDWANAGFVRRSE